MNEDETKIISQLKDDFHCLVMHYKKKLPPKAFLYLIVSHCTYLAKQSAPEIEEALELLNIAVNDGLKLQPKKEDDDG